LFTKIDLIAGYNIIWIGAGDDKNPACRTRYEYYENLVMPFGMAKTAASFQNIINEILKDMIDVGIITYIDDILIYSETKQEHEKLVNEGLSCLQMWDFVASIDKFEFTS
jgi:hypothetical protein